MKTIIKDFNCDKCSGICCINPPELKTIDEINKALELDVKVLIIKDFKSDKILGASVKKEDGKCPFLEDEKCKIYEHRFIACKEYECEAKSFRFFDIREYSRLFGRIGKGMNIEYKYKNIKEIEEKLINDNYEIVTLLEFADINLFTDINTIFSYLDKIINKNDLKG